MCIANCHKNTDTSITAVNSSMSNRHQYLDSNLFRRIRPLPIEYHVNVGTNQRYCFRTLSIFATTNVRWIPFRSLNCWTSASALPWIDVLPSRHDIPEQQAAGHTLLFLASSIYAWHRHALALNFPSSKLGLESLLSFKPSLSPYLTWPWQYAFIKDEFDCAYPL